MATYEKKNNSGDKLEGSSPSKKSGESSSNSGNEVFEICQNLAREYDQLSPVQVRQRLQTILKLEQEASVRRENKV